MSPLSKASSVASLSDAHPCAHSSEPPQFWLYWYASRARTWLNPFLLVIFSAVAAYWSLVVRSVLRRSTKRLVTDSLPQSPISILVPARTRSGLMSRLRYSIGGQGKNNQGCTFSIADTRWAILRAIRSTLVRAGKWLQSAPPSASSSLSLCLFLPSFVRHFTRLLLRELASASLAALGADFRQVGFDFGVAHLRICLYGCRGFNPAHLDVRPNARIQRRVRPIIKPFEGFIELRNSFDHRLEVMGDVLRFVGHILVLHRIANVFRLLLKLLGVPLTQFGQRDFTILVCTSIFPDSQFQFPVSHAGFSYA